MFGTAQFTVAQERDTYFDIGVGALSYKGDLGNSYKKWTSSFHMGLQFNKKRRINGAIQINIGNVQGQATPSQYSDPDVTPNTFVDTRFFSFNYDVQVNMLKNEYWKVYASAGIGLLLFTPRNEDLDDLQEISSSRQSGEEYSTYSFMLPLKVGFIHYLPNRFGVGMETGFYNAMTDYLDNISEWGEKDGNDNIWSVRFSVYYKIKG